MTLDYKEESVSLIYKYHILEGFCSMVQKEKVVPVRSMMVPIGSSSTASFIVNLDTRWR